MVGEQADRAASLSPQHASWRSMLRRYARHAVWSCAAVRRAVAEDRGVELQAHQIRHVQRCIRDGLTTLALGDGWRRVWLRLRWLAIRRAGRRWHRRRLRLGQPIAESEPGTGPIGGGLRYRCYFSLRSSTALHASSHREGAGALVRMDDVVA